MLADLEGKKGTNGKTDLYLYSFASKLKRVAGNGFKTPTPNIKFFAELKIFGKGAPSLQENVSVQQTIQCRVSLHAGDEHHHLLRFVGTQKKKIVFCWLLRSHVSQNPKQLTCLFFCFFFFFGFTYSKLQSFGRIPPKVFPCN